MAKMAMTTYPTKFALVILLTRWRRKPVLIVLASRTPKSMPIMTIPAFRALHAIIASRMAPMIPQMKPMLSAFSGEVEPTFNAPSVPTSENTSQPNMPPAIDTVSFAKLLPKRDKIRPATMYTMLAMAKLQ